MTGLIEAGAIWRGAAVALIVVVPFGLAQYAVADSAAVWLLLGIILAGFALGGYVAALASRYGPLTNGGLAALAAFAASMGVNAVIQVARGEEVAWVGLPMVALISISCGLLGAWVETRQSGRTGGARA